MTIFKRSWEMTQYPTEIEMDDGMEEVGIYFIAHPDPPDVLRRKLHDKNGVVNFIKENTDEDTRNDWIAITVKTDRGEIVYEYDRRKKADVHRVIQPPQKPQRIATKPSYKDARGAVPRPPGAPLAEDAIRKGRD